MNITITSAIKLSATQKKTLSDALLEKFGKNSTITEEVDQSVIGGVRVTADGDQWDATVAHTLVDLRQQLG